MDFKEQQNYFLLFFVSSARVILNALGALNSNFVRPPLFSIKIVSFWPLISTTTSSPDFLFSTSITTPYVLLGFTNAPLSNPDDDVGALASDNPMVPPQG